MTDQNTIQLSVTVFTRLKKLVEVGRFETVDDAATFFLQQFLDSGVMQQSPTVANSDQKGVLRSDLEAVPSVAEASNGGDLNTCPDNPLDHFFGMLSTGELFQDSDGY
jgi:hypothetical protein